MILEGDCLEVMRGMEDDSVDLVFCSPPYEVARSYGMKFQLKGEDWVAWALERFLEPFILSFCPPGGTVLDCFCGSGTTLAVAKRHGRNSIGIDVRRSQVELSAKRLS